MEIELHQYSPTSNYHTTELSQTGIQEWQASMVELLKSQDKAVLHAAFESIVCNSLETIYLDSTHNKAAFVFFVSGKEKQRGVLYFVPIHPNSYGATDLPLDYEKKASLPWIYDEGAQHSLTAEYLKKLCKNRRVGFFTASVRMPRPSERGL